MVERLVHHENPEGRLTPVLLLMELRAIDPRIELVYFGGRDWRLGSVSPEGPAREARAKKADLMLRQFRSATAEGVKVSPKNYLLALLNSQGFAQIAKYTDHGDISGSVTDEAGNVTSVLAHFRNIQSQWVADGGEQAFKTTLRMAAGDPAREEGSRRMRDYLATDGRDHYARECHGRVQFGPGGMTGGRERLLTPGSFTPAGPIITGEQVMAEIAEIMADLAS